MAPKELEQLDRAECMRLMEGHPARVGRIAIAGPRPVIFPVNYALDGDSIVFRTDPGTKFHAAVHRAFVAFEVDWVEPTWEVGWSVVVRGQAKVVDEPSEVAALRKLPLIPWAEGEKANFVRIETKLISGRRLKI
jgi:uncharacterized protein